MANPIALADGLRGTMPLACVQAAADAPRWDGSDPAGRTLLVRCEPDLGECIQLARYLPLLTGRRADVALISPPSLLRLFARLPGVRAVALGEPQRRPDAQVMLGDLPMLFGTTAATIPTFVSYLRPAAALAGAWRDRLRTVPSGQRPYLVGCTWNNSASDECESETAWTAALPALAPIPGIRFVSIGRGSITSANLASVKSEVCDVAHKLNDLADTAAVITQLDLVLAADSVIAHLAGALGKPVWTLVPVAAEGCWSGTGKDTPWYPAMRLFRQTDPDDWSDVLAAVYKALRTHWPAVPARPPLAA